MKLSCLQENLADGLATVGRVVPAKSTLPALSNVLLDLPSNIVLQRRNVEITVWFALVGALLVMVAIGLSQWWNRSVT